VGCGRSYATKQLSAAVDSGGKGISSSTALLPPAPLSYTVRALTTKPFHADNTIERSQEPGDEAMNLTISLDEALVEQLRRRASAKDLSPEQTARQLLGRPAWPRKA
jgi:hypothetical protein